MERRGKSDSCLSGDWRWGYWRAGCHPVICGESSDSVPGAAQPLALGMTPSTLLSNQAHLIPGAQHSLSTHGT